MKHPEDAAQAFAQVWNTHEMTALAPLFCPDATFVNRFGHYVRGIEEIIALHVPIHETIYSDSTMENEIISTIPLGESAAILHCWSRLTTGPSHPAGPHSVDTVILAVLKREDTDWRIQALENVTLVNPRTGQPILRS